MQSDVIVVGAGIIGCASAHALAAAGARVRVIEMRGIGQGASQASAGVLAPYIEGHQSGPLRDLGRRSLDLYDGFIARARADSGQALHYDRRGTLEVAVEREDEDRFRQTARALARDRVDAEWLDPEPLRVSEPLISTEARGGLLIPLHGFVGVRDLTAALAAAAVERGAQFTGDARVVSIGTGGNGRPAVRTQHSELTADRVVLAAGAWSGQISVNGADAVPTRPVRGQLLHLTLAEPQPLRHVLWGPDCYLVPWPNGSVLVGATSEDAGFDERATAAGVRDLLEAACTLVPQLWQASFAGVRVGLRPALPDGLPIVGESSVVPGLIYATGHYRNGVLLAPLTAALVEQVVMGDGKDDALKTLDPARVGRL